ncbi:hypothetical protein D3OALGA1CA_3462 [Olavius algarvensis associated proteobacterium Delta 3]|nr:hypothetical protein D3OALGB2SA_3840 [Olavius algarvensis associated proteobacterium Delta 3]CAB5134750.1 hypothetical protein D3OALGA1CA_3462 [Olavius algarvensis associated proteobacterium Delta 3]
MPNFASPVGRTLAMAYQKSVTVLSGNDFLNVTRIFARMQKASRKPDF